MKLQEEGQNRYHRREQAIGGGNYTVTNLIVEDLVATLAINNCGHNIAAAFTHYGKAVIVAFGI